MGVKYKTGEFVGDGFRSVTIEHGLGEVPFLFVFVGDEIDNETSGMFSGMWMNTGVATRYTTTVSKDWIDCGATVLNDGTNAITALLTSSKAYGVQSVDKNTISIACYANSQNFTAGKTYHWIAIADWRS